MEADVALHTPEPWAGGGEGLFEPPEQLKYIYASGLGGDDDFDIGGGGGGRRDRGGQKSRHADKAAGGQRKTRGQIRLSKSFDEEFDLFMAKDAESFLALGNSKMVKDDLSLSYAAQGDAARGHRVRSRDHHPAHLKQHQLTARATPSEQLQSRGHVLGGSSSSPGEGRAPSGKSRHRDKGHGKKSRSRHHRGTSSSDASDQHPVGTDQTSSHLGPESRHVPIEFPPKEDPDSMFQHGPTDHTKRPTTLSSRQKPPSSSSPPLSGSLPQPTRTSSRDKKSGQLVILEVKDGPTFYYKQADHMVTDSGLGDDSTSISYNSALHASSGQGSVSTSCSAEPSDTLSPGQARRLAPLDTRALTHASPASPDVSSPRSKRHVSHLPRAMGLRKPDLSLLTSSSRERSSSRENVDVKESVAKDAPHLDSNTLQETPPAASMPLSSEPPIKTESHPVTSQAAMPSASVVDTTCSATEPRISSDVTPSSVVETSAENPPKLPSSREWQDPRTYYPSFKPDSSESLGFQNKYEMMLMKAGVRHEDIVVGPRRDKVVLRHDEKIVGPSAHLDYDSLGPDSIPPPPTRRFRPPEHHPVDFYSKKNDSESQEHASSSHVKQGKYGDGSLEEKSSFSTCKETSRIPAVNSTTEKDTLGGSAQLKDEVVALNFSASSFEEEESGRWRAKEKKSGIHRPKRGKRAENVSTESGYATDITKSDSHDHLTRTSPDTLPRRQRASQLPGLRKDVEERSKSKSASPSPVKRLQYGQAQSDAGMKPKSASSTPTKKGSGQKQNMLSNIPVPMSHDPPAKKAQQSSENATSVETHEQSLPSTPAKKQFAESSTETVTEGFAVATARDSVLEATNKGIQEVKEPVLEAKTQVVETNKPVLEVKEHATTSTQTEPHPESSLPPEQTYTGQILPKSDHPASTVVMPAMPQEGPGKHEDVADSQPPKVVSDQEDVAGTQPPNVANGQVAAAGTHPPQEPIAVKPRLYRSVEQLFGDVKLTVFSSTDNVQRSPPPPLPPGKDTRIFSSGSGPEVDEISPLKHKRKNLPKIGILRRGSDRTEVGRRLAERAERAAVPISKNDPSVEDLKKATSLRELCHSVASLLQIDNERAAEMITTSLSERQDLVEGLDADAILDYLSHHGVLDPQVVDDIDESGATLAQRNSAILKHVEEHGNTAVALFINALRQSGQLHLASLLDTEQRITPAAGEGYLGKGRHKGEITVRIDVEALKILAPREPRHDKAVDSALLASPGPEVRDGANSEEEDFVKPRSCWCFCFSRKSRSKSASSRRKKDRGKDKKPIKYGEALPHNSPEHLASHGDDKKDSNVKPHRSKSKEKRKKSKEKDTSSAVSVPCHQDTTTADDGKSKKKPNEKKSKAKSKPSGKSSVPENPDLPPADHQPGLQDVPGVAFRTGREEVTFRAGKPQQQTADTKYQPLQQQQNGSNSGTPGQGPKPDKDNWDPIIMEFDPKMELVKLRAGQEELASPTRQTGNASMMVEQWKSAGRYFLQKAKVLCERIIEELHTEIIKYFEQDRGTLVLDVVSEGSAIRVVNICMKRADVERLKQDVDDESMLDKLQDMFFSKVDIRDFDIRGVKLCVILDSLEVNAALSEVS